MTRLYNLPNENQLQGRYQGLDIKDIDLHLSTLINLSSLDVRSEIDGVPGIISSASATATVECLVTAKRHAKGRQGERQRKGWEKQEKLQPRHADRAKSKIHTSQAAAERSRVRMQNLIIVQSQHVGGAALQGPRTRSDQIGERQHGCKSTSQNYR